MNKQNGHRTQDHRNGSRTRTPPTCTFSSGIALSQPGLHLAASFPEQPPPCCVKARSASEGRPRPHPAPPSSPSRRSAWPAAPCRRCTPCTCCRRSGSSAGAPRADPETESSPWRYTLQPGCRSRLSCLIE